MAYTLTYSGGTITVTDGTLNTSSTSLALPGRNYAGYGSPVDQNMVSLLENFASSTSGPTAPIKGQVWFDGLNSKLKYNVSTTTTPSWVTISSIDDSGNISAGNITVTGTITASYIISTINHVFGVETGITASGTNQATARVLIKDMNVVSTVAASSGVRLPVTTGGMKFTIVNAGANALNVYPATSAQINAGGTNVAYSVAVGARLDFISTSSTQWYTLNATYS